MTPGNDRRSIATFAIIALLILGMAVVNFTNLATARASQRAREVALRKVLGATRKQLIVQFVGESILISAVSMLLALALVELLVRPFAAFLDADLALSYFGHGRHPAAGDRADPAGRHRQRPLPGLLPVAVPAGAGAQGQSLGGRNAGLGPAARRRWSCCQFAVSIGLIICTAVIYGQTVYARSVDPGYKRDHILQVDELGRAQLLAEGRDDRRADEARSRRGRPSA